MIGATRRKHLLSALAPALACSLAGCGGAARGGGAGEEAGAAVALYQIKDPRVPPEPVANAQPGAGATTAPGQPAPAPEPTAAALVTERRWVKLAEGKNQVRLAGVSARLSPSSTWLSSLSDPDGTRVLGLSFDGGFSQS